MNKKLTSSRSVGMRDIKSLLCSAHMGHFLSHWPKEHNGFTLIELLVVILIIGILAAVALPQYQRVRDKAHAMEAVEIVSILQRGTDDYVMKNGYTEFCSSEKPFEIFWPLGSYNTSSCWSDSKDARWFFKIRCRGTWGCWLRVNLKKLGSRRVDYSSYYGLCAQKDYTTGAWTRICMVYKNSALGERVCTALEKDGWIKGTTDSCRGL